MQILSFITKAVNSCCFGLKLEVEFTLYITVLKCFSPNSNSGKHCIKIIH